MYLGLNLSLKQKLSQSQIMFLQLLPMTNQELEKFLEEESMENPLLEKDETAVMSFSSDFTDSYGSAKNFSSEDAYNVLMNIPQPTVTDINTFFIEQLDEKKYSYAEWELIKIFIENLDENGFLDASVLNDASLTFFSEEMIEKVLSDLKKLEPAGCFASDLVECLIIQLDRKNIYDKKLRQIIEIHLDDLLNQRITYISRKLGITNQQVRKYIATIASLDPKPLSGFYNDTTAFVIPDIVCGKTGDEWRVDLNTGFFDGYCLSDYYCAMAHNTKNAELKSYFNAKMARVKMIMDNIEQRQKMIKKLMHLLIEVQNAFFEGKGKIVPFTMAAAADILEVSPSTITRAVKNKYIQYPGGTIPMKSLFTTVISEKTDCSSDQIKEILTGLVKKENPDEPYSDFELAEMLESQGLKVSRRTVAKYRSELGIQSCYDRRRYA